MAIEGFASSKSSGLNFLKDSISTPPGTKVISHITTMRLQMAMADPKRSSPVAVVRSLNFWAGFMAEEQSQSVGRRRPLN
jgi:hypothetical protein